MPRESITRTDIDAYVDDQLDLAGRMAVEEHLAADPAAAARVMAELRQRSALRLISRVDEPAPAALQRAMARAVRRFDDASTGRWWHGIRIPAAAAAAMVLLVTGIPRTPAAAGPPAFVEDALMAHRTALIRARMASQVETKVFDAREIARTTSIRVPVLPSDWRISDVQLFPSDEGPALQMVITTTDHEAISIFAVRDSSSAPATPIVVRRDGASVAYWRHGDISYAMTGATAPDALEIAARDLADNRLD